MTVVSTDVLPVAKLNLHHWRGQIISPHIVTCHFCEGSLMYFGGTSQMIKALEAGGWQVRVGWGWVCPVCLESHTQEELDRMAENGKKSI